MARIGGDLITRTTLDHWFEVVSAGYGSPARARDHRPPLFRGCVAKARKATRSERPRPRIGQLRKSCRALYERRRDEALAFLVVERWLAGEAAERGVAPTAEEHEAAFQRWRLDEYPREPDYLRFLRENRRTEADARLSVAVTLLEERLTQVATAGVAPVTELDVAAYYDGHHEQFTRPELRDFRLLRTRTRAAAAAARRALERGQTWRQVGRRLGVDWVSVAGGRKQRAIARGTLGRRWTRSSSALR